MLYYAEHVGPSAGRFNAPIHRKKRLSDCHHTRKQKARYIIGSGLLRLGAVFLVGRAGFEPATNGLKVRHKPYFTALIDADRINTNQQLTRTELDKNPAKALIEIRHFSENSLTSALTSRPM